MASDLLKERFTEIEKLAHAAGLQHYDVHFFEVPTSYIYNVSSYGLPTRYSHWSFGASHQYTRTRGEMGYSKIYELVLNCNPCYAFLDKSNLETTNLLVAAHVYGHSDFFANNIFFQECGEQDMVHVAAQHAEIIDNYRKEYGDDEVDKWLDIALSLEQHVDVYKGRSRKKYPSRHIEYHERSVSKWNDLHSDKDKKPLVEKKMVGMHIPPEPEKDILWFLAEYSNLEDWQKRILEIIRRESYYFYPQFRTKILNEGWATYWHAELMGQYTLGNDNDYGATGIEHPLTAEEHLEFAASHEKVAQAGFKLHLKVDAEEIDRFGRPTGQKKKAWNPIITSNPAAFRAAIRLNPYYVGFQMLRHIKEKWDEYYEQGYRLNEFDEKIPVTMNGNQKLFEIRAEEDDVSFFRKYLTDELVEKLHLFSFGNTGEYYDNIDFQDEEYHKKYAKWDDRKLTEQEVNNKTIVVRSKKTKRIINTIARQRNNYMRPNIVIRHVDETGLLRLEHIVDDEVNLDVSKSKKVLLGVQKFWRRPVELIRKDKKNDCTWVMQCDGSESVLVDVMPYEWPDEVEENAPPSSW